MKVLINVGGKGTRMGDLTKEIPKALILVNRKSILEHQILELKKYGLSDIILATGFLSDKIEEYFGDGSKFGVSIIYSKEEQPLGTAGTIKLAEKYLGDEFMVLQGDIFINFDIKRFIDFHKKKDGIATIFVHKSDHPYDSDMIQLDSNSKIEKVFRVKIGENFVNLTNAGVFIFNKRVLEYIPKGFFIIEKDLYPVLLENNEKIYSYHTEEFVKDMGTLERLKEIGDYLKRPGAIFFDRDGVINEDMEEQVYKIEDFKFIPNSINGLKLLNNKKLFVVTNQGKIGIGICKEKDVEKLHKHMIKELKKENVVLDGIYYCPHHSTKGIDKYKLECDCRKPKSGMLLKAAEEHKINLGKSWMVGDKRSDIKTGKNVGCKTILVRTGYGGKGGNTDFDVEADFVVDDLYEAAKLILRENG